MDYQTPKPLTPLTVEEATAAIKSAQGAASQAKGMLGAAEAKLEILKARNNWTMADHNAAEDAIRVAQQQVNDAENAVARAKHRAGIAAEQHERDQALAQEQAAKSAAIEASAKTVYKEAFLASGGKVEDFEAAFKVMWQKHLIDETAAKMNAHANAMRQSGRYSL